MTTTPGDAFEAGLAIADALQAAGIPYALGGALAYGQYGIPRATNDVDVNVFVGVERMPDVATALRQLGIEVDVDAARRAADAEGMVVLRYGDFRIDVFLPSIAFAWEAERTRVAARIDGRDVWFLSAEALCVFKMLFFRAKDLVDLERLLAVSGRAVDVAYVRDKLVEMMGADDPRVTQWDRVCREHLPEA
jgi:hypothetical protein